MRRALLILSVMSIASACGGAAPPPPAQPAGSPPPEAAPAPEARAEVPPSPERSGRIARQDLVAVLDGGLGRFLGGVRTEPALEDGHFVGFRLEALFPGDARMADLDLRAGDVVTRVNGQPIERPEQALRVWNGLRVASELLIEYQRGGEHRELRFEIVD